MAVDDVQSAGNTAWQDEALVLDQDRVDELPAVIELCVTVKVTVGGTLTITGKLPTLPQLLWQTRE
jgi:hypothetical protein